MTIRNCFCGNKCTTKNSEVLAKTEMVQGNYLKTILWFNCNKCRTTFVIVRKELNEKEEN